MSGAEITRMERAKGSSIGATIVAFFGAGLAGYRNSGCRDLLADRVSGGASGFCRGRTSGSRGSAAAAEDQR